MKTTITKGKFTTFPADQIDKWLWVAKVYVEREDLIRVIHAKIYGLSEEEATGNAELIVIATKLLRQRDILSSALKNAHDFIQGVNIEQTQGMYDVITEMQQAIKATE